MARHEEKLQRALLWAGLRDQYQRQGLQGSPGRFKGGAKQAGVKHNVGLKIFECTGVGAARDIALGLLGFVGKLIVVGFGMAKEHLHHSASWPLTRKSSAHGDVLPDYLSPSP